MSIGLRDLVDGARHQVVLKLWQCPECQGVAVTIKGESSKLCPVCVESESRVAMDLAAYVVEPGLLERHTLKAVKKGAGL